jgi:hypothetical protein
MTKQAMRNPHECCMPPSGGAPPGTPERVPMFPQGAPSGISLAGKKNRGTMKSASALSGKPEMKGY